MTSSARHGPMPAAQRQRLQQRITAAERTDGTPRRGRPPPIPAELMREIGRALGRRDKQPAKMKFSRMTR